MASSRRVDSSGTAAASTSSSTFRFAEAGEDVLGEIVEQHRVGRQQVVDRARRGRAARRAASASTARCTASGQPPVALMISTTVAALPGRGSSSSTSAVVMASSSAPMRATSPAARRRAMRRFGWLRQARTRCSRGGRWRTSVSRNSCSGIVVGDVDVVEHDDRVGGDDRVGRGAHVRRQGGDLVAVVRRVRRRVGRQHLAEIGVAVCQRCRRRGLGRA